MKQYIKYLLLSIVLPLVVSVPSILGIWWVFTKCVDLKADDTKHIAVFGNSMGEYCINDSILPQINNCCHSSQRYAIDKNVIISYLKQNTQVDTVLLVLGEFSYIIQSDKKKKSFNLLYYKEYSGYVAYLGFEIFNNKDIKDVIRQLYSIVNLCKPKFGYKYLALNNLHSGKQWSTAWFDQEYPTNVDSLSFEEDLKKRMRQHAAIMEIISYCHKSNRAVIIFQPPTYHISNWIDDTNYNKYLLSLDDVLIADYTYFEFPDDTYRGDVQHLNHKGAEYFCKYIRKNGWHFETPHDYVERRNKGILSLDSID